MNFWLARSWPRRLCILGLVAAGLLGAFLHPERAAFAYLSGYLTVFSTVVTMLILIFIGHVCGATWLIVLRRAAENVVSAMPALLLMLIPVLVSASVLYPALGDLSQLPRAHAELVAKRGSFNLTTAFVTRSFIYAFGLLLVSETLYRLSLWQDSGVPQAKALMHRCSVVGLLVVPLLLTFASFDWFMALDPVFYSNIYGLYVFAGGMVAALALLSILASVAQRHPQWIAGVTDEHLHALGRLLFGFVCFWAYIAFSQALLIWIADVPEEVGWMLARGGEWGVYTWMLIVGHFSIPFLFLLFRFTKRHATTLLIVSIWLLVCHVIDCQFQVLPALSPRKLDLNWLDSVLLLAQIGVLGECIVWRSRGVLTVPLADPLLQSSLNYQSRS